MKVDLETLPALLAECGEEAKEEKINVRMIVMRLSARCAFFAGIVGKMGAHIAELEKKIDALAPKPPAEKTANGDNAAAEPVNAEAEEKAPDDLDAEILEMARALNGGQPAEVQEAAMQKGETL